MSVEPIIAFFLLWDLRKILRATSPLPEWDKNIKLAMYAVAALFIIEIFLPVEVVTMWIWHLLLFAIIAITYFNSAFFAARTILLAVLPFVLLALFTDIFKLLLGNRYKVVDNYLDVATLFSITWMVAMLIVSRKQQKALEKERQKTHEEEEQKIWMAERKAELEQTVAERTAELTQQKEELEKALVKLRTTQAQLIQQEKLASLGELTAGIAHEIQNPLNFVNNFSDVSAELLEELKVGVIQKLPASEKKHADEILSGLTQNLEKITHHGRRADSIVKSMMQHSRSGTSQVEPTDINALADEYLRLAYHGLRSKDKSFNARLNANFDDKMRKVQVVSQDISRVLLNLYNNAFYSVQKKKKELGNAFSPAVKVRTKLLDKMIEIRVGDNGTGIPQDLLEKIYQPFFTTKPPGDGIGLGLSLTYDIIKAHGGEIKVETKEGEYAEFIISLPVS
jgi:C4-dicarboxylate-specific signal transduction histidine kinase